MPKSRLTPVSAGSGGPPDDAGGPREAMKQEFARRLSRALLDYPGGPLKQSDLARAAGLGRDAISTYCRGRSFPEPDSLRRICQALGKKVEDLVPDLDAMATEQSASPGLALHMMADGKRMWLRINQAVTMDQAARIMAVLGPAPDDDA